MNNAIITGSIGAIARQSGKSIAETFLSADVVVIVDTSGSMTSHDSLGGKSRYDVACEELAEIQNSMPGKIAVLSFSDHTIFCPGGKPTMLGTGTDVAGALRFARVADVPGMRFVLISDGEPDDPRAALNEAKKYQNRIDVIFVGPEAAPRGRKFLEELARVSGGQMITKSAAKELASGVRLLLNG